MGYPMTYARAIHRNGLEGNYSTEQLDPSKKWKSMIAGDFRRMEQDMLDDLHISIFAKKVGISKTKTKTLLEEFLKYQDWTKGDWFASDPFGVKDE